MCGLAGVLRPGGAGSDEVASALEAMSRQIRHRGPDDSGTWIDAQAGVGLAHRRLSILDLSAAGHQPMLSACGRYVIVLNGEIYNVAELRAAVAAPPASVAWRGHSDTEVLIEAIARFGIESTLARLVGMFAFALWDRHERCLTLARDRMGEKPLYYGWQAGWLLFGSELKALRAHPSFDAAVDRDALAAYFDRGYVPAPRSIYAGIRKLPPGSWVQFRPQGRSGELPVPRSYWTLAAAVAEGAANPFRGSEPEAVEELGRLLRQAVGLQSVADVPVGAFLSGGVDSSLVVALMQAQSAAPVRTFTIGVADPRYDEAGYAREVAAHLGTLHTEHYITPQEALAVIPALPGLYDEPFGDSSAIPTLLVSQITRRAVTVSLSGDGGDELFGGYGRYARTARIWAAVQRVPRAARRPLAGVLGALSFVAGSAGGAATLRRLAAYVADGSGAGCYQLQTRQRADAAALVRGAAALTAARPVTEPGSDADLWSWMMYSDSVTYLPDDILTKVDRATMSVGLEARVPMLDHRIVEFAWRLPHSLRTQAGTGKRLLKQSLRAYLPGHLVDRPKMGFGIPVAEWLGGPLRGWAEALLAPERLRQEGFVQPEPLVDAWQRLLRGDASEAGSVWQALAFQSWLESSRAR